MCVCRLLHLCAHICEPFLHFHNIEKIYIYMSLILQNYLLRCKCISNLPVPISCITFINYFTTASHSLQFFFFNWMYFSENPYIYFSWNFFFLFQKKKKTHPHTYICLFIFIFACGYLQCFSSMSTFNLSAFAGYHPACTVEGDLLPDGKCGIIIIGVRMIRNFISVWFSNAQYILRLHKIVTKISHPRLIYSFVRNIFVSKLSIIPDIQSRIW